MRLLAFDLETSKITPEGDDIQAHRPLGISCWAMAWMDKDGAISTAKHGLPDSKSGIASAKMTREECQALVLMLKTAVERNGYTLLTHNGVGFDLDILAEESGLHAECVELALQSIDTCLYVHCVKGFPVGLNAIAQGFGLSGKTEGMSGALAPVMWAEGKHSEVLEYVAQDARTTLEVGLAIERHRQLKWISKTGRTNILRVDRLLTVEECLKLKEPDTSWMDSPLPRERFVGWLQPSGAPHA